MRTTFSADDRIATALNALANRAGRPFEQVVNEAH
jgi:hypothetical protein